MFNNRFNSSKNDPLIEAVKAAQHDGECRRQAEKIVNEEFGVYSRKAVVREQLAAYDAALEEVYANLKEGITIEPSEINPVPRKPEVGSGNVPHQTGSGKTINPKDNKEIAVESKKLAKKDYDKDGKIESPKDEVWGSRFRAAKAAGKMEEGITITELPPSAAAKEAGAKQEKETPASTPAPTKSKDLSSTFSSARGATGMQEAQINELSRTTLKSYVKKANRQANDLERKVNTRKDKPGEEDKMYRRIDGVNLAHDKMKVRVAATNEEALDEISKELAGRYIKKASRDALQHGAGYAGSGGDYKHLRKGANRVRGIEKAVDRLAKEETQIDEATRKHFRQHAADISKISDQGERNKAASAAADTYARLNPRFDHAKFHAAAGSTAHEVKTVKESVIASLLEKYSFKSAQVIEANAFDLGKTVPDTSMKIRGGAYPSVAARLKDMAGIAGRGLARGLGNPVTAGVMAAMEPTPANSGENEFARQAKYAPKTASAPAVTPKPAAPAPTSTAAPTPAPAKPGFYKGGSQGDYTIKKGDTLSNIAKNTGQSVADLAKMNNISDVNKISSGAKLMTKVPTPPSRPADATPSASPAPKPAEPEFKGRMIPPSDSGVGASPPPASFVGSKKEMRSSGPATAPLTSKDFGRQPPASMQESVQVGANKYRIV